MASVAESLNFLSEDIIPKERRNRSRFVAFVGCLVFLFLCVLSYGVYKVDLYHILHFVMFHIMVKGMSGLLKGVCDFTEEIYHLKTRYSGKYTKAIGACVKITSCPLLCFGLVLMFIEFEEVLPLRMCICLVGICDLLYIAFGFQIPTQVEISSVCDQKHLNVAQGLAWNYYIGYLKIILPRFKVNVRQFNEENSHILGRADTCKLHILIPLSCTLYDNLSSADNNIQHFKNLPSVFTDRAGIRDRPFTNSVYCILDEERRPSYCIVEYATPLSSLYEMSNISSTAFSRDDRIEQAKLFYRTLQHILETALESDYRHSYRLIVYDDCEENNKEERNSHFLSNLILKHIEQQQREEYPVSERNIDN